MKSKDNGKENEKPGKGGEVVWFNTNYTIIDNLVKRKHVITDDLTS